MFILEKVANLIKIGCLSLKKRGEQDVKKQKNTGEVAGNEYNRIFSFTQISRGKLPCKVGYLPFLSMHLLCPMEATL